VATPGTVRGRAASLASPRFRAACIVHFRDRAPARRRAPAPTQSMPSFKRISVSVHRQRRSWERPVVKAMTYGACIAALDFLAVYTFTRQVTLALGFMVLSLSYRIVGGFVHERVWSRLASSRTA
jgi:uncharacterized membrane protein